MKCVSQCTRDSGCLSCACRRRLCGVLLSPSWILVGSAAQTRTLQGKHCVEGLCWHTPRVLACLAPKSTPGCTASGCVEQHAQERAPAARMHCSLAHSHEHSHKHSQDSSDRHAHAADAAGARMHCSLTHAHDHDYRCKAGQRLGRSQVLALQPGTHMGPFGCPWLAHDARIYGHPACQQDTPMLLPAAHAACGCGGPQL